MNISANSLSKHSMNYRMLALFIVVATLTSGCTKGFSSQASTGPRTGIDFHSRDMIVPDFNGGRTVRCPNVKSSS